MASYTSAQRNTVVGTSGLLNLSTGADNVAVGSGVGATLQSGTKNTLVGTGADVAAASGIVHATALGADAVATASNRVVLGTSADTVVMPGGVLCSGATGAGAGKVLT